MLELQVSRNVRTVDGIRWRCWIGSDTGAVCVRFGKSRHRAITNAKRIMGRLLSKERR